MSKSLAISEYTWREGFSFPCICNHHDTKRLAEAFRPWARHGRVFVSECTGRPARSTCQEIHCDEGAATRRNTGTTRHPAQLSRPGRGCTVLPVSNQSNSPSAEESAGRRYDNLSAAVGVLTARNERIEFGRIAMIFGDAPGLAVISQVVPDEGGHKIQEFVCDLIYPGTQFIEGDVVIFYYLNKSVEFNGRNWLCGVIIGEAPSTLAGINVRETLAELVEKAALQELRTRRRGTGWLSKLRSWFGR